jgi:pimeloyl-ACP methyl ester carboxylesterase
MIRPGAIAHVIAALLVGMVAPRASVAQSRGSAATATDPSPSAKPPASMEEITISSGGARMNGLIYLAAGAEPRPVVVFLHGYPGNERNLDLAQDVRRAGYQALYVDYRGMWGSGGTFSFAHALEDVQAVLAWVRSPANAARYRLDPRRIALVGHSMGGWLALLCGAREPQSVCVAGLAAWNVGGAAQRFSAHADERTSNLAYFRTTTDPAGGPVRAAGADLLNEMIAHATAWDYLRQAPGMRDRALLLVAATRDTPDEGVAMHEQMARAVRDAGGRHVTLTTYEDDHPFSSHRIALAGVLTHWLATDCAGTQHGQ